MPLTLIVLRITPITVLLNHSPLADSLTNSLSPPINKYTFSLSNFLPSLRATHWLQLTIYLFQEKTKLNWNWRAVPYQLPGYWWQWKWDWSWNKIKRNDGVHVDTFHPMQLLHPLQDFLQLLYISVTKTSTQVFPRNEHFYPGKNIPERKPRLAS